MSLALSIAFGALAWTLLEYVIHRWLGHDRRFVRGLFGVQHTAHHSRGDYFGPAWMKVCAAAGVAALFIGPSAWILGWQNGAGFVAGLIGCYAGYELIHRLNHVVAPRSTYGRWARRHHFYHHFHNPKVNHGVTTPLWDVVFGTYVRPTAIHVPTKLAMRWLVDPETGEIHPAHRADFRLRGKQTPARSVV